MVVVVSICKLKAESETKLKQMPYYYAVFAVRDINDNRITVWFWHGVEKWQVDRDEDGHLFIILQFCMLLWFRLVFLNVKSCEMNKWIEMEWDEIMLQLYSTRFFVRQSCYSTRRPPIGARMMMGNKTGKQWVDGIGCQGLKNCRVWKIAGFI